MRPWLLLLLLALVFGLVGAGLALGGLAGGVPVLAAVGLPFLLVGALLGVGVPRVRAQHSHQDGTELTPVTAREVRPTRAVWSLEEVGAELAWVLEPTPYLVEAGDGVVRVRADLADARFLTLAGARRVVEVRHLDVVPTGDGTAVLRDGARSAEWTAGVGEGGLRFAGRASVFSGRRWSYERRVELGVDREGPGRVVDYEFSSAELHRPVREVLARAGWRVERPAEATVALVMAAVGGSAVVLVPLAFLVVWLVD